MKEETLEGIVLRSVAVQESRHILTLFTLQEGLLSLATPRTSVHQMRQNAATALLSRSEFCLRKGRTSDVYRVLEASLIEAFDDLRNNFSQLSAAGEIIHLILRSQLPGKPAPMLYALLLTYLRRLCKSPHPLLLTISFQLKLLKHEGLFTSTSSSLSELGSFSQDDWNRICLLTESRSFAEIENSTISAYLAEKVGKLFDQLTR